MTAPPPGTGCPPFRHARDITDEQFLAAIDEACHLRGLSMASRWDIAAVLVGQQERIVADALLDSEWLEWLVPPKVVLAKARRLIDRDMVVGCACTRDAVPSAGT